MANAASTKLKNITQRNNTEVQATPHCESCGERRVLGFINKGKNVRGIWIVREEVGKREKGKAPNRVRAKLGLSCVAAEEADANPAAGILSYAQALARAEAHVFPKEGEVVAANDFTVAKAVEQLLEYDGKKGKKKTAKAKADQNRRLTHAVLNRGLGDVLVNALTSKQLLEWRVALTNDTSEQTALRYWKDFHSCLERAFEREENGIKSNAAWAKLPKLNQDFDGRVLDFSHEVALDIIAVARTLDAAVADYYEGLYRAGTRPGGELLDRTVGDYVPSTRRLMIPERNEENRSKTGKRTVSLDADGVALFTRLVAGRPNHAPLFSPDGVRAWGDGCTDRARISNVLRAAAKEVLGEAAPADEDVVPYVFRHTFISRRLESGMPEAVVAVHCGTSVKMIKKNYAKWCHDAIEEWMLKTAPKAVAAVEPATV